MSFTDQEKLDLFGSIQSFAFMPEKADLNPGEARYYRVTVQNVGEDKWAVMGNGSDLWLEEDARWYHPSFPQVSGANREKAKYSLEDAIRIARELPDTIRVNGRTFNEWEERFKSSNS